MANPIIPDYNEPVMDGTQTSRIWYRFLKLSLGKNVNQPSTQVVPASPAVFTATNKGMYVISGGTVSAVELQRNGAAYLNMGVVAGPFPVQEGDLLKVTYTALPVVTFVGG